MTNIYQYPHRRGGCRKIWIWYENGLYCYRWFSQHFIWTGGAYL